jgi:hypothetical protein
MSTALHDRLLLIRHATAMASVEYLRGNACSHRLIAIINQPNPNAVKAGGRSAPTLRTAGSYPAPSTARAVPSSRHQAPRRRAVIGLKDEGRFSMCALPRTFVQGSTSSAFGRSGNQMSAVPYTQRNTAREPKPDRQMSGIRRNTLWLHSPTTQAVNFAGFHCAPDTPASISGFISQSPDIKLFVTLSGKAMQRPLWWRGWKTRPWLKRLFGTILNPSTAAHGVTEFISSLPVIPANLSAFPGTAKAGMILDTFGPTSPALLPRLNPNGSSPRMSKGISIWDVPTCATAFAAWATRQKAGLFSAREAGASHRRGRIFILAHANSFGFGPLCRSNGGQSEFATRQDNQSWPSQHRPNAIIECRARLDSDVDGFEGNGLAGQRCEPPLFAPGPGDLVEWQRIIDQYPYLQPKLLRADHGLANRVDESRACGNGVCSMAAALAWSILKADFIADAGGLQ